MTISRPAFITFIFSAEFDISESEVIDFVYFYTLQCRKIQELCGKRALSENHKNRHSPRIFYSEL